MIRIDYPFTAEQVAGLRVGQRVLVTGRVFTGRDRFHRFIADGGKSPVDLTDGAIYHCGPVVVREGSRWRVMAAGPTTSMRQEPYTAKLIAAHRLRLILGKGGMGDATRKACQQWGCVYLQTVGGAGALLAASIEAVNGVHFLREFGEAEAVWDLMVRDLEAVVTMDTCGNSLHQQVLMRSAGHLAPLLRTGA